MSLGKKKARAAIVAKQLETGKSIKLCCDCVFYKKSRAGVAGQYDKCLYNVTKGGDPLELDINIIRGTC